MLVKTKLDLAQLDAEAADLDLVIIAAEELDIATRQIASEIASAIHAPGSVATEGIAHEALRGQIGAIEVSASDPCPADIDFADRSKRHGCTDLSSR